MIPVLTYEAHQAGEWGVIATMELLEPERGAKGACRFEYGFDHASEHFDRPDDRERFYHRISCALPVEIAFRRFDRWPAFVDDLRPGGASARWWTRKLGLERASQAERDVVLLERGTIAPVGNLRIREAVPEKTEEPKRFPIGDVIERRYDFLEHAAEMGGAVGGATGAGGEAPKLLLRVAKDDQIWIDTWQDEPKTPDAHYLVKFARGRRTARDQLILRSEYVYYQALAQLGIETIDVAALRLEESLEPSLWLPRFDVTRVGGLEERHGMDSLYALIDAAPGSFQSHFRFLDALHDLFSEQEGYDRTSLTVEYVRRDLVNVLFGNSDNHGRNTSVLRTREGLKLAPVYDFAPMKMDPEGVIRTTRWSGFERGSIIDWAQLIEHLSGYADPARLRHELRVFSERLKDLPEILGDLGLSDEVLRFPSLGLSQTAEKLTRWGVR